MVAQMAARSPHDRKVVGSNPAQSYETRFLVKDVLLLSHIVIKKERDNLRDGTRVVPLRN